MAKSYLLNLATDCSAPMNNLGILEGSVTKTATHLRAFPLDASKENTVAIVDSTYTECDPCTTRETTSEMLFGAITTPPGSSSPEEKLPVPNAAALIAEDPPPNYSPTPTTDTTRNLTEATVFSMGDDNITSEGGHLTSEDVTPESDLITTAVTFMNTFSNFINSVTDKFTLLKETPSEFNTKLQGIETSTADVAEGISTPTHTTTLSDDTMSLTAEEAISYTAGSISSISNDAFPMNDDDDDDDATDAANEVSDFIVRDLEEGKITEFDRTIPSEEDDPNAMAKVNGIIEEKDVLSVTDLTNSKEEDTTMSKTSNSIEEDTADDNRLWMEGNPEDELNATALVLNAFKIKDHSVFPASEAKNTCEDRNTIKVFFTKLLGRPIESVTNATDSLPGSPTAGRHTDSREDSTTETDASNPEEGDANDTL